MAKFYTPTKISENIRETPEGYLFCLGVPIARTGWQLYGEGESPLETGDDGTVKVFREEKEVFRPETIASFQGKPITIRHPNDFVNPINWQMLARGIAQNVRKGEKDEDGEIGLLADLLITEATAIGLIKAGLREISCGYEAEYEQTGEGEGRQFNIIGNHIALVEEGRAGTAYAIMDHKGKGTEMKPSLLEKLKARFGSKVIDEVMEEDKKAAKTTDEGGDDKDKKDDKAKDAPTVSNMSYDELYNAVQDLKKSFDEFMAGKKDGDKKDAKDADPNEMPTSLDERVKVLEAAVQKLCENATTDEDSDEDGDGETDDADGDSEGEEGSTMTGDTAARVEILAPGLKRTKGEKEEALKARAIDKAYSTEEGKKIIDNFTGGKKPTFDSAEKTHTIFIAASECLRAQRGTGLEGTKNVLKFKDAGDSKVEPMTAEKQNEINAAHWARK